MIIKIWLGIALILIGIILLFIYKGSIKRKLQERIEKNSVKIPNLTYTLRGRNFIEDVILKRSGLPFIGDWARIYPVINEDGKTNMINLLFGGRKNFIKALIILGIIALFLLGYYEVFHSYELFRETCIQINGTITP